MPKLAWNGFRRNLNSIAHCILPTPTLPGHCTRPLSCQIHSQWHVLHIRLRQPSSWWKNAQISHPLVTGRLWPRAKARSTVLSSTQWWFAAATTTSLTFCWTHFQGRPGVPSFSEQLSRYFTCSLGWQAGLTVAIGHSTKIGKGLERLWTPSLFLFTLFGLCYTGNPANLLWSQNFREFLPTLVPC